MPIRVDGADEVRAAALLFARAPRTVQAAVKKESQTFAPQLKAAALRHARDDVSRKVAASARTTVTAKGLRAVFGSTGKHGSAPLRELAGPWEFGGNQQREETYLSRRNGKSMKVTRRTQVQIPPKTPTGRFVYPAVAATTPKLVGMWVRAIVKAVTDG